MIGPEGAVLIGPEGAVLIGPEGAVLIGPEGAVLIGPEGAVLIGPEGALGADAALEPGAGEASVVPGLDGGVPGFAGDGVGRPVTVLGGGVARAIGCVAVRGGVWAGDGRAAGESASGRSSGSGASAGALPVTAGIPIIVPVDDLALRITRPFDHKSSV